MRNGFLAATWRWFDRTVVSLGREMRFSYLPPLMIYVAAGISSLTAIVGTFFVKDYLGLSAAFLAGLGFWAGIPWALKMPLGHLVDLFWRWKFLLVFVGAGLIALSLGIMLGLVACTDAMSAVMPVRTWYVLSVLLAPVGYVIQDVVADAMTVEAVPRFDDRGEPLDRATERLMHTTMQTLGRVAIIGGGAIVALLNIVLFRGVENLPESAKVDIYIDIYLFALVIPVVSVAGVLLGLALQRRHATRLAARGFDAAQIRAMLDVQSAPPSPNWWILGGSLVFVVFTLTIGFADPAYSQEIVFAGSMLIVLFLIHKLSLALDEHARRVLVGTALLVFVFRALPTPGAGSTWWMIDELGFDQQFLSVLALVGSSLTLAALFVFRRFVAERSMAYIIGALTVAGAVLTLPNIGLYYGVQEWTAAHTGGIVDARFIALADTALESPLGQIAMIPMLAWIANSAPTDLKATFFAVMASFTNLSLSLSQLGTKYLNQIFVVTREVRDRASGELVVAADYSEVGRLFLTLMVLNLLLPLAAIAVVRLSPMRSVGDEG